MVTLKTQQKIFLLCLLSLPFLITSCGVPSYNYHPYASDGKVAHNIPLSGSRSKTDTIIWFEKSGIEIQAKAYWEAENQVSVYMSFLVPEGKVVIFENRTVASMMGDKVFASSNFSYGNERIRNESGFSSLSYYIQKFMSDLPMTGRKGRNAYFWYETPLSVPDSRTFVIRLPNILVDDVKVQLPLISFTQKDEKTERIFDPIELLKLAYRRQASSIGRRIALQKALDVSNGGRDLDKYTLSTLYLEYGRTCSRRNLEMEERYYRKSLDISERFDYNAISIACYYNISTIYFDKRDSETTCKYLRKAVMLLKELKTEPIKPPHGFPGIDLNFIKQNIPIISKLMKCDVSL